MDNIITVRLSITPDIAIRTISFEKVRSDLMAIRRAMKYDVFKLSSKLTRQKNYFNLSHPNFKP